MTAPYYQDDAVTLYCGDSLDIMSSISGVDLVVTSPPYNLKGSPWATLGHYRDGQVSGGGGKWKGTDGHGGVTYESHDDAMPWAEYEAWQHDILRATWGTLSDRGAIYYNHKPRVVGETLWMPTALNPGLPLRQVIVWARSGGMNYTRTAYMSTHEWIMVMAKPAFRLKSQGASGAGDVWHIKQEANKDHPAPFPLGIPAQAIETTAPGLVLDPFAGSGTTLRAAKDAGVPSIGIEKSERYCEVIANRLSQSVLDLGAIA